MFSALPASAGGPGPGGTRGVAGGRTSGPEGPPGGAGPPGEAAALGQRGWLGHLNQPDRQDQPVLLASLELSMRLAKVELRGKDAAYCSCPLQLSLTVKAPTIGCGQVRGNAIADVEGIQRRHGAAK
ncbi:unnamed protein product [Gongylonema pulchrum]|uniref:Uncharacterized protein n=1 Tax=Gongylonema pulchrum TaxID=637853 RepID=A0A3P7P6Y7_9BILA|nr:unnamed protein product [Gongylonema pulchrum]